MGWRRLLAGRLLVAAAAAHAGCGDIEWAPAPFTPVEVSLVYSPVEDLSRVRFRVADPTSLRFELADGAGNYQALDFAAAPFASGAYACAGAGACYQAVVRGQLVPPVGAALVRARHASFGLFAGTPVTVGPAEMSPVTLTATPSADNRKMTVTVVDWLTATGLARKMQLGLWSEPQDDCTAHPERASEAIGVEVPPGQTVAPMPSALTDDGRYCVRARTLPADGGAAHQFAAPLLTFPVTVHSEFDFQPPSETAPIVWRYVSDLEIKDPSRCQLVDSTVHASLTTALSIAAATANVDDYELSSVTLAPQCTQSPQRTLDSPTLADETKAYLATHYTNRYQRPLLFYVNSQDATLDAPLVASLENYRASFLDPAEPTLMYAIASDLAQMSFGWDAMQAYAAIEDQNFLPVLQVTLEQMLPFRSEVHDDNDIVPLLDPLLLQMVAGGRWKVCSASPTISRLQGNEPVAAAEVAPLVENGRPPGFKVALQPKLFVPAPMFMSSHVVVRYELCTRYCGHPFLDAAGGTHDAWDSAAQCVGWGP